MTCRRLILAAALLCVLGSAATPEDLLPDPNKLAPYAGINPKDFGRFWEKWPLVTVRYREDNGEQRFTYANAIAWEALRKGSVDFPDGALFAKVATNLAPDPWFSVSRVPDRMTRMQFMTRDRKKFADTGGWGYAIYPEVTRGSQPEKNVVQSCFVCHELVKAKGYVFSEPAFLTSPNRQMHRFADEMEKRFSERTPEDLTPYVQRIVRESAGGLPKSISYLAMPLFGGSLSESLPVLGAYAKKNKRPYLLIDESTFLYLFAMPAPSRKECKDPVTIVSQQYVMSAKESLTAPGQIFRRRTGYLCNGKFVAEDLRVTPR